MRKDPPPTKGVVDTLRRSERIKKLKVVYDPSDNNVQRSKRQSISSSFNTLTNASPSSAHEHQKRRDSSANFRTNFKRLKRSSAISNSTSDVQVPNVKDWTVNEVFDYMFQHFPYEANLFKEQEIDGASLLLLQRTDILLLPLKMGPALRLYKLILEIQLRNCGN